MIKMFWEKLKESLVAIGPIVLFIVAVSFTPLYSFSSHELGAFLFGSALSIVGIALFNMGADLAMTPMGKHIGSGLTKKKKLGLLLLVSFVIGVLVTVSEPDLGVLAGQLSAVVSKPLLVVVVGVGVGAFLIIAILKIVFKKSLSMLLMFFYLLLFALALLTSTIGNGEFLPLAFDSGGVTTGPITVPFIMALGIGIAKTFSSKDAKENSFGLVALCSCGAVIAVLVLSIFFKGDIEYVPSYSLAENVLVGYFSAMPRVLGEVSLSMGLIVVMFVICQVTFLKLSKKNLLKLGIGILITLVGLTVFLTAVDSVFAFVGYKIGTCLANANSVYTTLFCVVIGALVVLAEPAIHVLVKQVEEVTGGMVTKRAMLVSLAVGVGLALGFSALRITLGIDLMYIVVPGYILSLALSLFVPPVYTAIAFDSGGVASGPLTSCFVLPLMIGISTAMRGADSVLSLAFGVVALVAMIPLITIQALGFGALVRKSRKRKIAMKNILSSSDEQIIEF